METFIISNIKRLMEILMLGLLTITAGSQTTGTNDVHIAGSYFVTAGAAGVASIDGPGIATAIAISAPAYTAWLNASASVARGDHVII